METPDTDMSSEGRISNELKAEVKGRGAKDVVQNDSRYKGMGGVFESLEGAKEAASDPSGPLKSIEGWIIIVTGLHEESAEDDLYNAFESYGPIKNLHLNLDRRTGFVKGYALIEYENYKEAKSAIQGMSGQEICGMNVGVDWAFSKKEK